MAVVAARNMVGGLLHEGGGGSDVIKGYDVDGGGRLPVYHPVPGFSSRFLDLSWRYGLSCVVYLSLCVCCDCAFVVSILGLFSLSV